MSGTRLEAITLLRALTVGLRRYGLTAEPSLDSEPPYVEVANPDLLAGDPSTPAPVLSDQIGIRWAGSGWLLLWGRGDVLGPADDIPAAVTKVVRVMTIDRASPASGGPDENTEERQ